MKAKIKIRIKTKIVDDDLMLFVMEVAKIIKTNSDYDHLFIASFGNKKETCFYFNFYNNK